eukprot:1563738-Amphidinium_carterae.1
MIVPRVRYGRCPAKPTEEEKQCAYPVLRARDDVLVCAGNRAKKLNRNIGVAALKSTKCPSTILLHDASCDSLTKDVMQLAQQSCHEGCLSFACTQTVSSSGATSKACGIQRVSFSSVRNVVHVHR